MFATATRKYLQNANDVHHCIIAVFIPSYLCREGKCHSWTRIGINFNEGLKWLKTRVWVAVPAWDLPHLRISFWPILELFMRHKSSCVK